ncbi:Protein casc1 [Chytriomyces hyalinus]|nr:Protein casc1 [Chytriomyces hyalinus]
MPKPGPKKNAKNAIDKALAEEEERKRLEEEARLAELRAKKERELKELRLRETFEAFVSQEKGKLEIETEDFLQKVNGYDSVVRKFAATKRDEADWKRFLLCSKLPDPTNEPELNTYLSLWAEETVGNDDDPSVQALVDALPDAEKLCNNIAEAVSLECDALNHGAQVNLRVHLATMRQLIQSKWDSVSCRIMQHFDLFGSEPNENFHYATSTQDYICGLWGNLTRNPRHKTIEYANIKLSMSLPKPISLANVAIRMLYESGFTASAPFFFQDSEQHMSVIGGVLFLDLFEMPEAPKTMGHMMIRQILSPNGRLKLIQYPFKKAETEAAEDHEAEEEPSTDTSNIWPAQICYDISPDCFIHRESAKMMSWDEIYMCWSDENIGDVEINTESGQIKFRTTQFRPTAFVQKTFAEFPLLDWAIEPCGKDRVRFRIQGSSNEICFEVFDGKCRLISPMNSFLETHVAGQWFTPTLFLMKLSQVGLNFQGPQSLKGVDFDPSILKSPAAEESALKGIGFCAQYFAIRRSPSNRHISNSKIALQVQRVVEGTPLSEDPLLWTTIFFDSACRIGENDVKIGYCVQEGFVTDETNFFMAHDDIPPENPIPLHSSFYSAMKSLLPEPEAVSNLEQTDAMFSKSIFEVLQATRLLSFSA